MTIPALRPERHASIRRALRFYQTTAVITGVLLLLLVTEMIIKYGFHLELEAGGAFGPLAFVPEGSVQAVNLSLWILIVHGWVYVIYLVSCYLLWQKMRWEIGWLLAMAAGGVVPFMSFIVEVLMSRRVERQLAQARTDAAAREAEDARLAQVEAGLSDEERRSLDAEVAAEVERRRRDADQ